MEFKDILKDLREKKNISQQTLADSIYVSRSAVAKWENGLGLPNEDSIEQLMKYFNVDREYLFPVVEQEEIVNKNLKINKLNHIIEITFFVFVILFTVFLLGIVTEQIGIVGIPENEYIDKTISINGYHLQIYEDHFYHYIDNNGEEKTVMSGDNFEDYMEGTLVWHEKTAYSIIVYKKFGFIYNKNEIDCQRIYLVNDKNADFSERSYAGCLMYIKDNRGTYHYFYDRLAGILTYPVIWEKDVSIEVNGIKQEMIDGYYFTSKYDLLDDEYTITVSGNEVEKLLKN